MCVVVWLCDHSIPRLSSSSSSSPSRPDCPSDAAPSHAHGRRQTEVAESAGHPLLLLLREHRDRGREREEEEACYAYTRLAARLLVSSSGHHEALVPATGRRRWRWAPVTDPLLSSATALVGSVLRQRLHWQDVRHQQASRRRGGCDRGRSVLLLLPL